MMRCKRTNKHDLNWWLRVLTKCIVALVCINLLERNWGARAYDCLYYRQCPLFGWWIWILQVFHNRAVNERERQRSILF